MKKKEKWDVNYFVYEKEQNHNMGEGFEIYSMTDRKNLKIEVIDVEKSLKYKEENSYDVRIPISRFEKKFGEGKIPSKQDLLYSEDMKKLFYVKETVSEENDFILKLENYKIVENVK